MEKRLWHKLDPEEYASLMSKEPSIEEILDNFQQPTWCGLPNSLDPLYGCEDLTDPETRIDICKSYCSSCRYFKKQLGLFGV